MPASTSSAPPIRLGTRGSALALWQAHWVAERLAHPASGGRVELVPVRTRGDQHKGKLEDLAGVGHFTSELESALADGLIDVAVHSLKDLPVTPTRGLEVAAVPVRHDPRDALVSRGNLRLDRLPHGARVGTSSPRRVCLVRARRPDLEIATLRGNVDTRVRSVEEGRYDAILVASAALERLGLEDRAAERFAERDFPPAPGQGALAVQVRAERSEIHERVAGLDDPAARESTQAERAFLEALGGGCSLAAGAFCWRVGGVLHLVAAAGSADGRVLRVEVTGSEPDALGRAAADGLLARGVRDLLR